MNPTTVILSAPSRLHLGLFPGPAGQTSYFGGAGIMLTHPRTTIRFHPSRERKIHGVRAERAAVFADRWLASEGSSIRSFDLNVIEAPPEHVGLGSGTQLALAVGVGLQLFLHTESDRVTHLVNRVTEFDILDVATKLGRAGRTVIGTRGFQLGGMVVDWGRDPKRPAAENYQRFPFPAEWPILLVTLPLTPGLHGQAEQVAFDEEIEKHAGLREEMLGLLREELMPAVERQDYARFAAAVFPFGCASGRIFEKVQGGLFCSPEVADLVTRFRRAGAEAVVQSSWGPTIGVVFPSTEAAAKIAAQILTNSPEGTEVHVTTADNHGPRIETDFQLPN
jgi:beta-ribofuranosylaminobenzene 5'-phosphate synthase